MLLLPLQLLLLPLQAAGADTCFINIDTQEKFAQMNTLLTKAIADGETNIVMDIAQGVYFFRENHLYRRNDECADVSIVIQGHDAVLIAAGNDYHDGDRYEDEFNPDAAFIDTGGMPPAAFDFWDECRFAEGMVEVVSEETKLCRLPVLPVRGELQGELYINIPQWYTSDTYKVEKVESGYLYFTVGKLEFINRPERSGYNVNYDYIIGGGDIRFRLCHPARSDSPVRIADGVVRCGSAATIHECRSRCFLLASHCAYRHFAVSDLHFLGNSSGGSLVRLTDTQTEGFEVSRCRFEAVKGNVLWADGTPNVAFSNNTVENCYNGISTTNSCSNTRVESNSFSNCGGDMKPSFCVNCKGKNYYIAHNRFRNFGYGAIGLGVWHGHEKPYESSGTVEHNEMWYDEDYIAHKERHTLMDAGAIYLWTKNDNVIIRGNYIHDIDGMHLNRGIFCDDGASHFRLYGNVIINIANSYSIDSRDCTAKFPDANQDIRMEGNIVDSAIKFEGSSKDDNGCVASGNVMLCKKGKEPPENVFSRLTTGRPDRQMTFWGHSPDGIVVDQRQMERLRKLPHYDSAIKAAKWRYKLVNSE